MEKQNRKSRYEKNWRWWLLGTLFFATFLNYFDRQTLANAIDPISKEFGLDNIQRGNLLSSFIYVYAACHLFIGFIVDRLKQVRIFFMIMVIGWSASTILVGLAQSYQTLLWLRYSLGVWESVNFPLGLMLIAMVFPLKERSLATGIFTSGGILATITSPYLVVYLSNNYNWRWSFVVSGALALIWIIPWLLIFRKKNEIQLTKIRHENGRNNFRSLLSLFKKPAFWTIAMVGIGILPLMYFITQWLPSFMTQGLKMEYGYKLPSLMAIIFISQNLGMWLGGGLVLWFSQKRLSVLNSRKLVVTLGFVFILSILFLLQTQTAIVTIIVLSIFNLGIGIIVANQHSLKQEVDRNQVASVAALIGFIETGMAAFVVQRVGFITEATKNFNPVFLLLVGFAFLSVAFVLTLKSKWLNTN